MQTRMSRDLFPREVLRQPGFLAGIRRVDAWLRALDKNVVHGRGDPRIDSRVASYGTTPKDQG
jgi:hypothetical protein